MHDPIGFGAFRCFPNIENESFLYANLSTSGGDDFVGSGGFPVPRPRDPVWSGTVWILSVSRAEEVPFFLTENGFACTFLT